MINNEKRISKLKPEQFQSLFGVKMITFYKMLEMLKAENANKKKAGRPPKISILDRLVIWLSYVHEYRDMRSIAFDYDISHSLVQQTIYWCENALIKTGEFALPSQRKLVEASDVEVILVDVMEQEIQRPKKKST